LQVKENIQKFDDTPHYFLNRSLPI